MKMHQATKNMLTSVERTVWSAKIEALTKLAKFTMQVGTAVVVLMLSQALPAQAQTPTPSPSPVNPCPPELSPSPTPQPLIQVPVLGSSEGRLRGTIILS